MFPLVKASELTGNINITPMGTDIAGYSMIQIVNRVAQTHLGHQNQHKSFVLFSHLSLHMCYLIKEVYLLKTFSLTFKKGLLYSHR